MAKFALMRRDPNRKSFADWRPVAWFDDLERAIRSREGRKKEDKRAEDSCWEYQIETIGEV